MLTIDMRYMQQRGTSWWYRRIVPADVQDKIKKNNGKYGRKAWTRTWRKNTPIHIVEKQARQSTLDHDREIAIARGQEVDVAEAESLARELLAAGDQFGYRDIAQGDASPQTAAVVSALEHNGRYVPEAPLLSVALIQDIERYGQDRDNYPVESSVTDFIGVISDQPVTQISRADATAWIDSLRAKGYAPATLRKRVGNMRGLINRVFLDLEIEKINPFSRHQLKGNGSVNDRLPFDRAMLARIDSYLSTAKRLKAETRHILQIMRNTGASPKEIGGLVLGDISFNGGEIPFMWIRVNALRGIKAAARDRQIPLVGISLEAMKEAHRLATARTAGESSDTAKLFEGFGGKSGSDAKLISKNINKAIKAARIPDSPRLSAYSLRHTFAEAMRSAGVLNHTQDRLLGHTVPGIAGRYGSSRAVLAESKAAIEKAIPFLGDVDDAIYTDAERLG